MNDPDARRFLVSRADLRTSRTIDDPDAPQHRPLAEGEARLRIDHFGLTANNITYAAFGEAMKYWSFFPTDDPAWGCIPVWGFAEVVESRAPSVQRGERCYGYWPMGRYLVVQPTRAGMHGFTDGAAHRATLPALYNAIQRCATDPGYDATQEAQQALLRPLFVTSFLIDDFLADAGHFGARQVLMSSASSKTAFGTAFCMMLRRASARAGAGAGAATTADAVRIVGLTSAGGVAFCRSLGCYDDVLPYDALDTLDPATPTVYVDFAGDAPLRRTVHARFGEALRYSCSVGGTHWDALGPGRDLPGPRPTLFFAPAQFAKRSAPPPEGWGPVQLQVRLAAAWRDFMGRVNDPAAPWLRVRTADGPDAVKDAYMAVLENRVDPREGWMLSL